MNYIFNDISGNPDYEIHEKLGDNNILVRFFYEGLEGNFIVYNAIVEIYNNKRTLMDFWNENTITGAGTMDALVKSLELINGFPYWYFKNISSENNIIIRVYTEDSRKFKIYKRSLLRSNFIISDENEFKKYFLIS